MSPAILTTPAAPTSAATGRARSGALALALCASVWVAASGCDTRASEVRSALAPAERPLFDRGAQMAVECWSCHDFYSTQTKIGPGLLGVMGRRAASLPGFGYSEALTRSGIVWTSQTLSAYLASPQTAVPGTSMVWRGVGDPDGLAALVFYVERLTRPTRPAGSDGDR